MSASLRHAYYQSPKDEQHAAHRERMRAQEIRHKELGHVFPRSHGRVLPVIQKDH